MLKIKTKINMTSNFIKMIGWVGSNIFTKNSYGNIKDVQYSILALSFMGGIHAIYAYSTNNKEDIKISNKYQIVNKGETQLMIVDDKGRHFNVNNSLWYWKWDSIEDWEKINKGDSLKVKYYGFRSPFLGLFPNIVRSYYTKV